MTKHQYLTAAVTLSQNDFPQLKHRQLDKWLDEPFFELGDVVHSRRDIAQISGTPCMRAASQLMSACYDYKIKTLDQLYRVGLAGLDRCVGVGERTEWIAACLLYVHGFNVRSWTKSKDTRRAIHLVHTKNRKRGKHE